MNVKNKSVITTNYDFKILIKTATQKPISFLRF